MSNLTKNFFYNVLLTGTSFIIPLITFPYATRVLGPEGIGLSSFANSFVQYFLLFATLGIPVYGVKIIAQAQNDIYKRSIIFKELLVLRSIITFGVISIYALILIFFSELNQHISFYIWGIVFITINIFDINWLFGGLENFRYITIRSVILQCLQMICLFLFVKNQDDVLIYFLLPYITGFLTIVINLNYARNFLSTTCSKYKLNIKKHVKPLFLIFSSMVAISLYTLLDTLLLGFMKDNYSVGIYSTAMKMNKVTITFIMALVPVMLPKLSASISNGNFDEVKLLTNKTILFVITVAAPIMTTLYFLAPEIIDLLAGKGFENAITTMRILCPITLIIGLTNNFSMQLLIPLGKEKLLLYSVLLGSACSIILNLLLIPRFAENGAAISNVMAEVAVFISCVVFTNKTIKIKIPIQDILYNILLALTIGLFAIISRHFFSSAFFIILCTLLPYAILFLIVQRYFLKNSIIISMIASIRARL